MKKLLVFLMLLPCLAFSQTKTVINVNRVFAKVDKVLEFEKALAAHAQKYHTGNWKWRVFEIQSGPDAGGYHITEGPMSWEDVLIAGETSAQNITMIGTKMSPSTLPTEAVSHSVYQEDLSTVKLTDYSDKINITHYYPKLGWFDKMKMMIGKMKKVWEAGGQSMAVYQASSSGPAQFAIVTRYKQGLKEREPGFRKPLKDRYEEIYGADSFNDVDEFFRNNVQDVWSELLFLRPDLSSK